ncbi:ChiQ/YbfN family lipoprotein [Pantoea sp. BAV 3049]|uniref:ChiQ/YbfN family lipoprotein n=1 Tax=Pantoea sp. BAV 3049 TaxID=2654188 RepID=UPI00131D5E75|nr:ChiQ/YbfN family lipoprotein [Pantoea sp. BAV 3049]
MKYVLPVIAMLLLGGCAQKTTAPQENIPSRDYQRCLDAEQMGGGEAIEARCGKLQQEIEQTPH